MSEQEIFEIIKNDDVAAFLQLINSVPEVRGYKFGNMPLLSVAVLFASNGICEALVPLYAEINGYTEMAEIDEVSQKFAELNPKFAEQFNEARFIEPTEIALLMGDISLLQRLLQQVGIKTLTARKRIEQMLLDSEYVLMAKGDSGFLLKKKTKNISKKRKLIWLIAICVAVAIIIPLIVLTSLSVDVVYYNGNEIYGKEQGLKGGKLTISTPEKEGYTFTGWYAESELKTKVESLPNKSTNLYAGWQINQYTITFDTADFEVENQFQKVNTANYGTKLIMPIPKVAGKLFVGWYDQLNALVTDNVYKKDMVLTPKFVDFSDNSADNPFEITDTSMMIYLAEQQGYFTFKNGLEFKNSISCGALTNFTRGFQGVLLGNNRTVYVNNSQNPIFLTLGTEAVVKDLNIVCLNFLDLNDYQYDRFGVLAAINQGKIQNVTVTLSNLFSSTNANYHIKSDHPISYVGILAGTNTGEIIDCQVDGYYEISVMSTYPSINYTGGLAGANVGSITNSLVSAKINSLIFNGGFGGIVGYNTGLVKDCTSLAEINAVASGSTEMTSIVDDLICQVGGIAANNSTAKSDGEAKQSIGEIQKSISHAKIQVSSGIITCYVGGIVGFNGSTIANCENGKNGFIKINKSSYINYVGGISGFCASKYGGQITQSTNYAEVNANNVGYSYIGGIAGFSIAESDNDRYLIEQCVNSGTVTGGAIIGGVVGCAYHTNITKCKNIGEITSVVAFEKDSTKLVGGIVGNAVYSSIQMSLNSGKVQNQNGGYNVNAYLGGIVGEANDSSILNVVTIGSINAYNGDVFGLICAAIDLKNGVSQILNAYAVCSTTEDISYNDYDSSVDSSGNLVFHQPTDITKPIFYPSTNGNLSTIQELQSVQLEGFTILEGLIDID